MGKLSEKLYILMLNKENILSIQALLKDFKCQVLLNILSFRNMINNWWEWNSRFYF